ncbi:lipase [Stylonychia lemnae]|uniref:Lipase n=1 Tax=Stylonychia lemnae TaxID=5949 RepID=A0A078BAH1_STYLE|nr:lipase [Stylonychia lemnae]|eukprot:CDW91555.1 lipase [Stylonychia lemnae]
MKSYIISTIAVSAFSVLVATQNTTYQRGLSDHFIKFLDINKNYYPYNFNRTYYFGGSFGGKENDSTPINRVPVVFVHGAGDRIYGDDPSNNGFRYTIEYFLDHGYTKSELYGSMWAFADLPPKQYNLVSDTEYIIAIRRFIEAVLDYTGAPQVDVISHSMGVPLSRAAIKGGVYPMQNIGDIQMKPINVKIRTFIGIAGLNHGVYYCQFSFIRYLFLGCNDKNGFYPGNIVNGKVVNQSEFVHNLNEDKTKEADNAYALISLHDYQIFFNGEYMSGFPTMDAGFVFTNPNYTHLGLRDLTADFQYKLLNTNSSDDASLSEQVDLMVTKIYSNSQHDTVSEQRSLLLQ